MAGRFTFGIQHLFLWMFFVAVLLGVDAYHRQIEAKYKAALTITNEGFETISKSDADVKAKMDAIVSEKRQLKEEYERLKKQFETKDRQHSADTPKQEASRRPIYFEFNTPHVIRDGSYLGGLSSSQRTPKEIQALEDENKQLRLRISDLESELNEKNK